MLRVKTMNKIADAGLQELTGENFVVGSEVDLSLIHI